jgi:uroporphyrinogen-III synthase
MARPRILITRSPHQASELADQLRSLGAEPVLIPTIELAEPSSFAPLEEALARLDTFHWLIFTSANAVDAFVRRAGSQPVSTQKIAAIGAATARALVAAGLRVDLMPAQAVAESLADALLPQVHQPNGAPTRFLLLRAEVARELLPDTLRGAGAEVTIVPVYRTVVPSDSIRAMSRLFSHREYWPAAITFTSSSTAINLLALLEAAGLRLPQEILRISIGPITSRTLRDLGFPPHVEATEPTTHELAAVTMRTLALGNTW